MYNADIHHNINFQVHYEPTQGEPKTEHHPGKPIEARILGVTLYDVELTSKQLSAFTQNYGAEKLQVALLDHADSMNFKVAS